MAKEFTTSLCKGHLSTSVSQLTQVKATSIPHHSFPFLPLHDAEVKVTMEIADAKEILFTAVASIDKVVSEAQ